MWTPHLLDGTECIAGVEVLPRDAAGHPGDQVIQDGRVQRRVLLALVFCTADTLPLVSERLCTFTNGSQGTCPTFSLLVNCTGVTVKPRHPTSFRQQAAKHRLDATADFAA